MSLNKYVLMRDETYGPVMPVMAFESLKDEGLSRSGQ